MVTMARRTPRSSGDLTLELISAYVQNKAEYDAVKSELQGLIERSSAAMSEAAAKNDAVNDRIGLANARESSLEKRENDLKEREGRLAIDRAEHDKLIADKVAEIVTHQRELSRASGEAKARESEAKAAKEAAITARDRAERETALAEASRRKAESIIAEMRAVIDRA